MIIEIAFFIILISLWFVWSNVSNKEPNGPYGLPLVGYLPFLRVDAHKQFQALAKTYGDVFSLRLGPRKVIVLNSFQAIKTALLDQSEVFSGRTSVYLADLLFLKKDVARTEGPIQKEQRRFLLSQLRDFGVGKLGAEKLVVEEADKLIFELRKNLNIPIDVDDPLFVAILNVSWEIAAGKSFKHKDPTIKDFSVNIKLNFEHFRSATILTYFPAWRFVDRNRIYEKSLQNNVKLHQFIRKTIDEHKETLVSGSEHRDFIDAFIEEIKKRKPEDPGQVVETHPFNEDRLHSTLLNFLMAGVETSATTLYWSVLFMSYWPKIQQQVQEELDLIIGKSRPPQYSDRHMLPYTEAVILEIQRYASINPLAIPHRTTRSTNLLGYYIPDNAEVIPNLYSVHHDPELWGDPQNFRPERFLGPDNKIKRPEYFIPFSIGGRYCAGEKLARLEIFMFVTYLLQNFQIHLPSDEPLPSFEPDIGITLRPKSYNIVLKDRIYK